MLTEEINSAKRSVKTDTVQITFGEVATMYKDGELNISPEFQRLFRWSDDRKSNFIESILIGIPVPPVFVFERSDGTWELIDGLQRISTVLEFMGILKTSESASVTQSVLVGTKYLPSLDGVSWVTTQKHSRGLDTATKLFLRRARIDFQILKHPSDPATKFDLFQRLNRGGAYANEQEVRSCSMVLADPTFTQRAREIAKSTVFSRVFRVTDDQRKQQVDLEYVVRLVVHTEQDLRRGPDVEEFLTKGILAIANTDRTNAALDTVEWLTSLLDTALGEDAMLPPTELRSAMGHRLTLRAVEAIAVGIARNRTRISKLGDPSTYVRLRIREFWKQPEVPKMSSVGQRGTDRIRKTVPFGTTWFNPDGR